MQEAKAGSLVERLGRGAEGGKKKEVGGITYLSTHICQYRRIWEDVTSPVQVGHEWMSSTRMAGQWK